MKNLIIVPVLLFVTNLIASEITTVKVTRLMLDQRYGAKVFVSIDGVVTRSNCHANSTWEYVMDASTESGKLMYSQLLAAHAAGKTVKIVGNDTCTLNSTVEDMVRLETY